ncbi:MAG: carbohydrate ABC transporter permease [Herpetosiphon sp.]
MAVSLGHPAETGKAPALPQQLILHVLLIGGAIIMVMPFIWMLSTSLKPQSAALRIPPQWIPTHPLWRNYPDVLANMRFARYFGNSMIVAVGRVTGQLITCSMAAFAFARLRFPGREKVFALYLAALMVPFQVYMIPDFILMKYLGWLNSYQALILPGVFSAFGIFLLRQSFMQVPRELEDAAVIDGASPPRILLQVILPLSRPALASLTVFTFLFSWNDLLWPLIVTRTNEMRVLPVALALLQGQYQTNWPWLMAGSVMATAPVLIVFLFAQRYFIEGIAMTGIKG